MHRAADLFESVGPRLAARLADVAVLPVEGRSAWLSQTPTHPALAHLGSHGGLTEAETATYLAELTTRPIDCPVMSIESMVMGNVLKFHHELYVRSGGRIGQGWLGVPCLLLTSTGAKSGQPRVSSLTYAEDGTDYVLVASKGGAPQSPAWYFNVRKTPGVTAQIGTKKVPATARILHQGDPDYGRLWKLANENNHNRYDAYQKHTERPIPIVVISPTS